MEDNEHRLRSLWDRALDGDDIAYREFLTALSGKLRPYLGRQLSRLGRDDGEAEDIVQEALLAVHGKRHTYDRNVPVMAWAHAIARYKMVDFLRTTGHASRVLPLDDIEHVLATDASHIETGLTVRTALAALPEKMRRSIELIKIGGLSAREAAALTGMSEAAVKVNVHRGIKVMARAIA